MGLTFDLQMLVAASCISRFSSIHLQK